MDDSKNKKRKYNISPEGHKIRSENGRRNLAEWKKRVPDQGMTKHGVRGVTKRKRYTDLRTTEGQHLKAIMDSFIDDLGGTPNLDTGQHVLLGIIKTKLITIFLISDYVDKFVQSGKIIDEQGLLIPILGQKTGSFISYTESLKKDLEILYKGNRAVKGGRVPRIEDIIANHQKEK